MPSYKRLDLGFTYSIIPKKKKKRNLNSDITCSIYNAYNRLNPFFLYIAYKGDVGAGGKQSISFKAYQVSLFPILPSVTGNFKF